MDITFELVNTLSPNSYIYPIIDALPKTVTLYPVFRTAAANEIHRSRDYPLKISLHNCDNVYYLEVKLISSVFFSRDMINNNYSEMVMRCLERIGDKYSRNRDTCFRNNNHPLYQLLENTVIEDMVNTAKWYNYELAFFEGDDWKLSIIYDNIIIHSEIHAEKTRLASIVLDKLDDQSSCLSMTLNQMLPIKRIKSARN
jgi:hypothetical protein